MFDILKKKEFWTGYHFGAMVCLIAFIVRILIFPSELEQEGRKKLCELKQFKYCEKEDLLKIIK